MKMLERVEAKIVRGEKCWEWDGSHDPDGYARVKIDGRNRQAHRVVYESLVGPIPDGFTLDHLCRNHGCVNPEHLEPVTRRINTLRGVSPTAVNARKEVCDHGHMLTPDNVYEWRGTRACATCRADRRVAA